MKTRCTVGVGLIRKGRPADWRSPSVAWATAACAALAGCSPAASPPPAALVEDAPEFALVELFTSQGCSSCPPADRVLEEIAAWSRRDDLPIFCLSFHVDYWNQLGWHDPYSRRVFSQRQQEYAEVLENRRRYTPQMIVNGSAEFIGARGDHAEKVILAALQEKPLTKVQLQLTPFADRSSVQVKYDIEGDAANCWLNLAVVQSETDIPVGTGENAGKSLGHANVVHAFQQIRIRSNLQGRVTLALPRSLNTHDAQVIGYCQDRTSLAVTAATAVVLAATRSARGPRGADLASRP